MNTVEGEAEAGSAGLGSAGPGSARPSSAAVQRAGEGDLGEWTRPRPGPEVYRADGAMAAALALGSLTVALLYDRTGFYPETAETWVWVLGIALVSLPLALRRRYPIPVALAVSVGFFVCRQFGVPDMLVADICLFLALYSVGAWEQHRRRALWWRAGIVAVMFAWVVVNLLVLASSETLGEVFANVTAAAVFSAFATFFVIQLITNLLYFAGALYFGQRAWEGAQTTARLEAQGRELERERATSAAQAVALDRVEIARELHGVVAHHVSVMGIQAAAARRSLDRDPASAAESLEVVEDSARTAVDELRGLVGTLRSPAVDRGSSALGTAQLSELVEETAAAGIPATLLVMGETRPLPMLVDVALYRVAQEALTNVRKHAGPAAEAVLRLRFMPGAVELEVTDTGMRRSLAAPDGEREETGVRGEAGDQAGDESLEPGRGGLGLRGMRERMGAVGGTVVAHPREHGGYLVRARVEVGS